MSTLHLVAGGVSAYVMASRFSDHRSWAGCAVATVARALGFPGVAVIPPAAATVAWFDTVHYVSLVLVYSATGTKTGWGCASQWQEPEWILLMYLVLNWVLYLFASYVNSSGRLKLSSSVWERQLPNILFFFLSTCFRDARLSPVLTGFSGRNPQGCQIYYSLFCVYSVSRFAHRDYGSILVGCGLGYGLAHSTKEQA